MRPATQDSSTCCGVTYRLTVLAAEQRVTTRHSRGLSAECRFPIEMSHSHSACHPNVAYDTRLRLEDVRAEPYLPSAELRRRRARMEASIVSKGRQPAQTDRQRAAALLLTARLSTRSVLGSFWGRRPNLAGWPDDDSIAYVKFMPNFVQPMQAFAEAAIPNVRVLTVIHGADCLWRVWGLSDNGYFPSADEVRGTS